MRWSLLAFALPLAEVVPVALPGGATLLAEAALASGLILLAQLDDGRPLVAALAQGGVHIEVGTPPLLGWGEYQNDRRAILVHPSLVGADPRTLAALLAHEATHAQGDLDGTVAAEERALLEQPPGRPGQMLLRLKNRAPPPVIPSAKMAAYLLAATERRRKVYHVAALRTVSRR
jgi:hypothetical protein